LISPGVVDGVRAAGVSMGEMMSFLENNDSHTFFKRYGGLVKTGPTGTNVCDLSMGIAVPPDAHPA
ncbi:MAG: hypothetical protein J7L61_00315, partial [Thermoplasmata archaeon]|nr:hypothetical protein [Thermoplasmata archaeon]